MGREREGDSHLPDKRTRYEPHPNPRYADRIRLIHERRGPGDRWIEAQVRIGGKWSAIFSLRTTDRAIALDNARDELSRREHLHTSGLPQPSRTPRLLRKERTFGQAAEMVLVDLLAQRDEAINRHGRGSGKVNTIATHISRIRGTLVPAFGEIPVVELTNKVVNTWARSHKVQGRRGADEKQGSQSTVGNWNASMQKVLDRAVEEGWIDKDDKPAISRKDFAPSEPRPWLAPHEVEQLRDLMTDAWVAEGGGREWEQEKSVEVRYLLRAYIALCSCTGLRPGEEMELIRPNQIVHEKVQDYYRISVISLKGRGVPKPRDVIVFENDHFDVRRILLDLLAWRKQKGAPPGSPLFAMPSTGRCPEFARPFERLMQQTGLLVDPETAHKSVPLVRVPYSLRHYFATQALLRDISSDRVALWMGTSVQMIEKTYSKVRLRMLGRSLAGRDARSARSAAALRRMAAADRQDPHRWHDEEEAQSIFERWPETPERRE